MERIKLFVRYSSEWVEFGCECCGSYTENTLTVHGPDYTILHNVEQDAPSCWDWNDLVNEVKQLPFYEDLIAEGKEVELVEDVHNNYL